MNTEEFMVWRKAMHPKMRRTMPVGLVHNGQCYRRYDCAICRASITAATRTYPLARRTVEFIATHNAHTFAEMMAERLGGAA